MNATPHNQSPNGPQRERSNQDGAPSPSEILTIFLNWLQHYWDAPRHKPKWTEAATVILTLLIAIAAIYSAWIFQGQLNETRTIFRIDERAWIEIEPIKVTLFLPRTEKIGAGFQYPIYIRNVGKTVARDIQLRATRQGPQSSVAMGDSAEALNWEQEKLLLDKVPTASNIPINNPVPKVLAPNTSSAVPVILNGQEPQYFPKVQVVSYLIGRIDYTDAFGVSHWMKFCFFVVNARGDLWNCKEGNDEDRNPENPPNKPN